MTSPPSRSTGRSSKSTGLTDFVGYEQETAEGQVLAIVADGETIDRADKGREVEVFLSRTPFYGESGGQVGDTGVIETETGVGLVVGHPALPPGAAWSPAQGRFGLHRGRPTGCRPSSTRRAGRRSERAIPGPMSSTGRFAMSWVSTPTRRGRWSSRAGSDSTSPISPRWLRRSSPRSRPRSIRS